MSARAREVLPAAEAVIEAFGSAVQARAPRRLVLANARELAARHQRQWDAEDRCRAVAASVTDVAVAKGVIDRLNAVRVALVEEIDLWVSAQVERRSDGALHTETLGSVIDRLAIAWVRAARLGEGMTRDRRAGVAERQMWELASAYDDLIDDVDAGRRRLPLWRPLKSYGSRP